MRKRLKIALAALFVALLSLILLALLHTPTPELAYQGKTLRQWLLLLDSDTAHKAQNDDSARAIESMGKQALPVLIHILEKRPAQVWLAKVEAWAVRFRLWRAPDLPLDEWQYRAARGCCILGGWIDLDITPAIPALAYHATNAASWRLEPYMWGLVYSGPVGLSIVTNLLASAASPQVREEAARSLWITPKVRTPEIAKALLSATRDVDASVRVTAILSLQSFLRHKGLDAVIVPGVVQRLQDTNSEVRRWTIQLLANYSSAPGVGAAMSNLLSDPVPQVASEAERALYGSVSNAAVGTRPRQ